MIRRFTRKVRQLLDVLNGFDALLKANPHGRAASLAETHYREWMLATHARYQDPRCLTPRGYRVYSQTDEDGIVAEIFRRLGIATGTFVEFGVEDGLETNTTALLQSGWTGVWLEGSPRFAASIRETFRRPLADGRLTLREGFVTAENIAELFRECRVPVDLTLLCIDIDGNDWWVWRALAAYRAAVVVVEYNADFGPSVPWVMPYDPKHTFGGTRYHGASLKSFEQLGRELGYRLVGCNFYGMNAFFVRDDLPSEPFLPPFTSEAHWEPARHALRGMPGGWPKDVREVAAPLPPVGG